MTGQVTNAQAAKLTQENKALRQALAQAALALDEAASILHGESLHGTALLFTVAAERVRVVLGRRMVAIRRRATADVLAMVGKR